MDDTLAYLTDGSVHHHRIPEMFHSFIHHLGSGHPLRFVPGGSQQHQQTANLFPWILNGIVNGTIDSQLVLAHVHGRVSRDEEGVTTLSISSIQREFEEMNRTICLLSEDQWGVLGQITARAGWIVGDTELNLSRSGLNASKASALFADKSIVSNLSALDLSHNQLGSQMKVVLEALLPGQKLCSLNLSNNGWIGDDSGSVRALIDILYQSRLLTRFDLSGNPIDDKALQRIGHVVGWNSTILRVDISDLDRILVGYSRRHDRYGLACFIAKVNGYQNFNPIFQAMRTVLPCLLSGLVNEKADAGGDGPPETHKSGGSECGHNATGQDTEKLGGRNAQPVVCETGTQSETGRDGAWDDDGKKKKKKKKRKKVWIYKPNYPHNW